MKIQLTDRPDLVEKDHFIHQSGKEPSEFNGDVTINGKLLVKSEVKKIRDKKSPTVFRIESIHGVPENEADNIGRLIFNTIDEKIHCDLGYKFKRISSEKFEKDFVAHDPAEKLVIDLSDSDIDDARRCVWQVCENSNDFERVNCKIKTPNEKTVVIEFPVGLGLGTFRVLGVE